MVSHCLNLYFLSNDVDHFLKKIFPLASPNPNFKNLILFQILVFIIKTKQNKKTNYHSGLYCED